MGVGYKMKEHEIVLSIAVMNCPLCTKKTFRTKAVLRQHLIGNHTVTECKKIIKKHLRKITGIDRDIMFRVK